MNVIHEDYNISNLIIDIKISENCLEKLHIFYQVAKYGHFYTCYAILFNIFTGNDLITLHDIRAYL